MRNKIGRNLFRFFFTLLGAGIGLLLNRQIFPLFNPTEGFFSLPYAYKLTAVGGALLFGLVFFILSTPVANGFLHLVSGVSRHMEGMNSRDLLYSVVGLIGGLVVAALISRLILAAGSSLFTVSFSALVYVIFGYAGLHIAQRRVSKRKKREPSRLEKLSSEFLDDDDESYVPQSAVQPKVIDSSVLIDGRLDSVLRSGFLEGVLLLPEFVLTELQRLADSSEDEKRAIGKRGLAMAERLSAEFPVEKVEGTAGEGVDISLLKLCRENDYALLTNDTGLIRLCAVDNVKTLSLCALADALKPPVAAGDRLTVTLKRLGKAAGQALAYLEDGTMVVVDNASDKLGQTVECEVAQVRSNAAGRIVFCRL